MDIKKTTRLRAALLSPLAVGARAWLFCSGRIIHTPAVVAIHRVEPSTVCFETRHMTYWLLPAVQPAAMAA